MKNLSDPLLARLRVPHPFGEMPDDMLPWAGAFRLVVSYRGPGSAYAVPATLSIMANRGGCPHSDMISLDGNEWDHVSVSTPNRCPTWEEMCTVKDLFFEASETVMQLHPGSSVPYINNHPYCLHLWRPIAGEIPLPPSILVGLEELNP